MRALRYLLSLLVLACLFLVLLRYSRGLATPGGLRTALVWVAGLWLGYAAVRLLLALFLPGRLKGSDPRGGCPPHLWDIVGGSLECIRCHQRPRNSKNG